MVMGTCIGNKICVGWFVVVGGWCDNSAPYTAPLCGVSRILKVKDLRGEEFQVLKLSGSISVLWISDIVMDDLRFSAAANPRPRLLSLQS